MANCFRCGRNGHTNDNHIDLGDHFLWSQLGRPPAEQHFIPLTLKTRGKPFAHVASTDKTKAFDMFGSHINPGKTTQKAHGSIVLDNPGLNVFYSTGNTLFRSMALNF